jgi:hypothetical protein
MDPPKPSFPVNYRQANAHYHAQSTDPLPTTYPTPTETLPPQIKTRRRKGHTSGILFRIEYDPSVIQPLKILPYSTLTLRHILYPRNNPTNLNRSLDTSRRRFREPWLEDHVDLYDPLGMVQQHPHKEFILKPQRRTILQELEPQLVFRDRRMSRTP